MPAASGEGTWSEWTLSAPTLWLGCASFVLSCLQNGLGRTCHLNPTLLSLSGEVLSSPGDIIETLETEKQIHLAVPVLTYMGRGGTQGDTGGHFTSGARQTEHALSCRDALGPFQLCDCSDGIGVVSTHRSSQRSRSASQPGVMMDFPNLSFQQLTCCLRAGAENHPGRHANNRGICAKEWCVYFSGTCGTVPEALLNQPGAVWRPPDAQTSVPRSQVSPGGLWLLLHHSEMSHSEYVLPEHLPGPQGQL